MTLLLIDDAARAQIEKVRLFAERAENAYRPDGDAQVPGSDPRFCAQLGSYRCVFSITELKGRRFRHLSVSIPAAGRAPPPSAIALLSRFYGYTGELGRDFSAGLAGPDDQHCIVCVQELERK